MKNLRDVKWLTIGATDEYSDVKKFIAHICHDVTKAACIDELCINDIVVGFEQKGYRVVAIKDIEELEKRVAFLESVVATPIPDDDETIHYKGELWTKESIYNNGIDVCLSEIQRLREALVTIANTSRSWEGRKDAPHWNLGDIARSALMRVE